MWQFMERSESSELFFREDAVDRFEKGRNRNRNIQSEVDVELAEIQLSTSDVLLEFGPGTSELSLCAATRCRKVIAVDISDRMIAYSAKKAQVRDIHNIPFVNAGFLSYEHHDELVDKVVTRVALHHIPDFWKQIAFNRISDIMKPGGIFRLGDVTFSFDPRNYQSALDDGLEGLKKAFGDEIAPDATHHFNKEFSTFTWIIEGMLERAGFDIINKQYPNPIFANYTCKKRQ